MYPEFICGHTRILARNLIVQPQRVVNGHGLQFRSDSTLGTVHVRMNQHGEGHFYNLLDSTFGDDVMMSSTISTKVDFWSFLN